MAPRKASETALRRELVEACRRIAALGLIGAAEGNLSVRLGEKALLTTPSGSNKAHLHPADLVVTDLNGKRLRGTRPASSELAMHVEVYRARPEVRAVVHAHPPTAVAFTLAGLDLGAPLMPEAVTTLGGRLPTAPYATPSTPELARAVAGALGACDACLMERHGAISVGRSLFEACDRMETGERLAQVQLRLRGLGAAPAPLPQAEVDRLLRLSGRG